MKQQQQQPKWINRLLDWYCSAEYANEIRGDLFELFDRWVEEKGLRKAKWLYIANGLMFLRMYNARIRKTQIKTNQMTMIAHYLKIAGRNMARQKLYTLANIVGLSVGIAVSLMIFLHVDKELSYEKAYPKHDNIYRLAATTWAKSSPTQGEAFKDYMPEVKEFCRFATYGRELIVLSVNERFFGVDHALLADQSAIDMFDYQFVAGSPEGALTRPGTAVLTESLATKVFGADSPVGQTIELDGNDKFEVTGVIKDLPANSHIKAELLVSMPTFMNWVDADWYSHKGWMVMYTYVLFDNEQQMESATKKMMDFQMDYRDVKSEEDIKEMMAEGFFYELLPLTDIHLHSNKIQEMGPNASITYIYIFITLAVFITIIACVNFVNIFVTISMRRIKEIGMRKVMGAKRGQLLQQFLGESMLTSMLSALVALLLCAIALPFYNSLAGSGIDAMQLLELKYLAFIVGIVLLIGLLAGAYPALVVSGFAPTKALSAKRDARTSGVSGFRKGLVVFQFVLSLFIIISTVAVTEQMNFVRDKDLGFSASHVVAVKTYGKMKEQLVENREGLFARLKENPAIEDVSLASNLIGDQLSVEGFRLASMDPEQEHPQVNVLRVDEGFLSTLDIHLLSGRTFQPKADTGGVYIINKKLAELWGVENPVGEMAEQETNNERGPIVGMIDDINYYSLHREVAPLVIEFKPWWTSYMLVEINAANVPQTVAYLEDFVQEVAPGSIFHYRFLDDRIDALYKEEYSMFKIFRVFSVLAILISCIGLLGLAAIEVQRRTKEIGIRKVLGATNQGIFGLLSRQFVVMIGIAIVVTVPVSIYAIGEWLANFEYHITPGVLTYVLPSVFFIALAFAMVGLQAFRAATANPSDSLRYE
jgi:putative ABC transport system permease protein